MNELRLDTEPGFDEETFRGTAAFPGSLSAPSPIDDIRSLITKAGGIFIGKDELISLEKLSKDVELPEIPSKFSQAFLNAEHPVRGGMMGKHLILGFDVNTNSWYCIERSIFPNTCNQGAQSQELHLLNEKGSKLEVEGVFASSPDDIRGIRSLLNNVVQLHLFEKKSINTAPFHGVWGRTADTLQANEGCQTLIGCSNEDDLGVEIVRDYDSEYGGNSVGLLVVWN